MINKNNLEEIIDEIKNNNTNYFIDNYSFSDRLQFVDNMIDYNDILEEHLKYTKDVVMFLSNIFGREESKQILNSISNDDLYFDDVNRYYISLFGLTDDEKNSFLHLMKYDNDLSEYLIMSFKNEEMKKENWNKHTHTSLYLNTLTDSEKEKLINDYESSNVIAQVISSMSLDNQIKYLKNNKISKDCFNIILQNADLDKFKKIVLDNDINIDSSVIKQTMQSFSNNDKIQLLKNEILLKKLNSNDICKLLEYLNLDEILEVLKNINYEKYLDRYDVVSIFYDKCIYKTYNLDDTLIDYMIRLKKEGYIEGNSFLEMPDDIKVLLVKNKKLFERFRKRILFSIKDEKIKLDTYLSIKKSNVLPLIFADEWIILEKLSDDNKIKIIKNSDIDSYLKIELIKSLGTDELKIEIVNYVRNDNKFKYILDNKILLEILEKFNDDNKRKYIINNSFDLDDLEISKLISSLSSNEINTKFIVDNFNNFIHPDTIKLVQYFENILNSVENNSIKIDLLKKIENNVDNLEDSFFPKLVICFKDKEYDNYKLYLLNKYDFKNKNDYIMLLNSIHSENKKKECIEKIYANSKTKALQILTNMNGISDEYKIEFLDKFVEIHANDNISIQQFIDSFKDVNLKIKYAIKYHLGINYINNFMHDDDFINHGSLDEEIVKYYSEYYKCDYNHLVDLINKYGNVVYRFFNSENIINLLNLDDNNYKKIMNMFNVQEMILTNDQHIDNVLSVLLQKKFTLNNRNILGIFNRIRNCLISGNYKELFEKINKVSYYLCNSRLEDIVIDDNNYIANILKKYNYKKVDEFIKDLYDVNKINSNLEILNIFTNKYILEKRNEFVKNNFNKSKENLKLEETYEKNSFIREWIKTKEVETIIYYLKRIDVNNLTLEEKELLDNENLLKNIVLLKKGEKIENKNEVLQQMKIFSNLMDKFYLNKNSYKFISIDCKKLYNIPYSKEDTVSILSNMNINLLKDNLLNNDVLYNALLNLLRKYKLIGWGNTFSDLSNEIDLDIDKDTICSFLNNFYRIYPNLLEQNRHMNDERKMNGIITERSITLTSLLNEALVYASTSYKYTKLLGKEDFKLIKSNPGPNSAPCRSEVRLDDSVVLIKEMYKREKISVPPLNENFEINDKKINVQITNSTDMTNLTMGERTGACMRIKGHADSLFRFCLTDVNGFHIKFMSDTGNFVSRVSGFRNGNTIFLNQLRYSVDSKYDAVDLIDALEKFSKMLIDKTKGDEIPIDNVVISDGFSMRSYTDKITNIHCDDIKKGLSSNFYSDVSSSAIVLATRRDNLTPIKLTDTKETLYDVSRQPVKLINNVYEIINEIDKIRMINDIVGGKDISDIQIYNESCGYKNLISSMYLGEDWYIVFDEFGNILDEFIIDRGFNKEFVRDEMNQVKNNIMGVSYEKNRNNKRL